MRGLALTRTFDFPKVLSCQLAILLFFVDESRGEICKLTGCTKFEIAKAYVKVTEEGQECKGDKTGEHTATDICFTSPCSADILSNAFGVCDVNPTCATALEGDVTFCPIDNEKVRINDLSVSCNQDPCTIEECCKDLYRGPFRPDSTALKIAVDECLSNDPTGSNCYVCETDGAVKTSADQMCLNTMYPTFIADWDTSNVLSMENLLQDAVSFNQDISRWDTSKVTDMRRSFKNANAFDQDISNWDVSSVTSFDFMFENTNNFNQNIAKWDVSSAQSLSAMFMNALQFNQDLSCWQEHFDPQLVDDDFMGIFHGASNFEQTLCWSQNVGEDTGINKKSDIDTTCTPQNCQFEFNGVIEPGCRIDKSKLANHYGIADNTQIAELHDGTGYCTLFAANTHYALTEEQKSDPHTHCHNYCSGVNGYESAASTLPSPNDDMLAYIILRDTSDQSPVYCQCSSVSSCSSGSIESYAAYSYTMHSLTEDAAINDAICQTQIKVVDATNGPATCTEVCDADSTAGLTALTEEECTLAFAKNSEYINEPALSEGVDSYWGDTSLTKTSADYSTLAYNDRPNGCIWIDYMNQMRWNAGQGVSTKSGEQTTYCQCKVS